MYVSEPREQSDGGGMAWIGGNGEWRSGVYRMIFYWLGRGNDRGSWDGGRMVGNWFRLNMSTCSGTTSWHDGIGVDGVTRGEWVDSLDRMDGRMGGVGDFSCSP